MECVGVGSGGRESGVDGEIYRGLIRQTCGDHMCCSYICMYMYIHSVAGYIKKIVQTTTNVFNYSPLFSGPSSPAAFLSSASTIGI